MSVSLTHDERVARIEFALKLFIHHGNISSVEQYYDLMVTQGGYLTVADCYYKASGLLKQNEVDDLYDRAILPRVVIDAATNVERQAFERPFVNYYKAEDHAGKPIPVPR